MGPLPQSPYRRHCHKPARKKFPKNLDYGPLYTETEFRQGTGRLSVHEFNHVRPKCPMYPKTISYQQPKDA